MRWSSISQASPSILQVALTPGTTSWERARRSKKHCSGSTSSGKRAWRRRAVDMRHLDRASAPRLKGMQQDEAGAVGEEIRRRRGRAGEPQRAVRFADDLRRPWQFAIRRPAERIEGHPEAGLRLMHRQIGQLRAGGIPAAVAHQKGDAAQRLGRRCSGSSAVPRSPGLPRPARPELDALGQWLRRAEQCDCPIKHFRRVAPCTVYQYNFSAVYRSGSRRVSIEACGSPSNSTMYLSRDNRWRQRRKRGVIDEKSKPGRFTGRRAVVTGASAGIGCATALRFAAEGARVGLVARRREPLEAAGRGDRGRRRRGSAFCRPTAPSSPKIAAAMDAAADALGRSGHRRIECRDRASRPGRSGRPTRPRDLGPPADDQPDRPVPRPASMARAISWPPAAARSSASARTVGYLGMATNEPAYSASKGGILRDDEGDGDRLRSAQYPGQHGDPRLHRHADERARHGGCEGTRLLEQPDSHRAAPARPRNAPRRSSGSPPTRRATASAPRSSSMAAKPRSSIAMTPLMRPIGE